MPATASRSTLAVARAAQRWVATMRRRGGRGSDQAGHAVRRDWPDGTHDLACWRATAAAAHRVLVRRRASWRRAPVRPVAWSVVWVSRRDVIVHGHRHDCRAPDCPTAATALAQPRKAMR